MKTITLLSGAALAWIAFSSLTVVTGCTAPPVSSFAPSDSSDSEDSDLTAGKDDDEFESGGDSKTTKTEDPAVVSACVSTCITQRGGTLSACSATCKADCSVLEPSCRFYIPGFKLPTASAPATTSTPAPARPSAPATPAPASPLPSLPSLPSIPGLGNIFGSGTSTSGGTATGDPGFDPGFDDGFDDFGDCFFCD